MAVVVIKPGTRTEAQAELDTPDCGVHTAGHGSSFPFAWINNPEASYAELKKEKKKQEKWHENDGARVNG